ncbi:dihydrolipoyl dehydrogenase [Candidatus Woesearchaeota archaeon]|nr:dihydrolipoyl dehydrogenase [Candidatus Woesearchaeota archaeon]
MVIGESVGQTDIAIIGAGPGGYTAAIRLAELGKKVTLIDKETVGGVCLNHGCIPTKALIRAAEEYHTLPKLARLGIQCEKPSFDFAKVQGWRRQVVKTLDSGIRALLKKHNITLLKASAEFEESTKLTLQGENLEINALEFHKCIIASGSRERLIPGIEVDGKQIITSWHAIELEKLPTSVLVIGGGYIGIEISQMLSKVGVKIIIVEALPSILSLLDGDIAAAVRKNLESMGTSIYCNAKVKSVEKKESSVITTVNLDGKQQVFETEKVLVAIGRVPDVKELRLENTKVKTTDKGFIQTAEGFQTHDQHIYAIGDIIGGVMLAHKAAAEAKIVAEVIVGKRSTFDALIPYAIFSDPEIAGVGMTERECKEKDIPYKITTFSYGGLGKAHIVGDRQGYFKVIHDGNNLLGFTIVGERASDMIGVAVVAMEMGATLEDLSLMVFPHPTLIEGFGELADTALGFPIHGL